MPLESLKFHIKLFFIKSKYINNIQTNFNGLDSKYKIIIFAVFVVFLVFFIIAFSAQIAFSNGLSAALEFIPVMLLFAVPFGFAAGVIYVLLALLILKGFVKFGLELKNS